MPPIGAAKPWTAPRPALASAIPPSRLAQAISARRGVAAVFECDARQCGAADAFDAERSVIGFARDET